MVGRRSREGLVGFAAGRAGYAPGMSDIDAEVEEIKEDEVLKREGLETELMEEGRSEEAENIADVETGEENL